MPERNLVAKQFVNSFSVLVVVLTLISMQVGCSKLRKSSLDKAFLLNETRPSLETDPVDLLPTKQGQRFVNDPQDALNDLKDAGGDFSAIDVPGMDAELDSIIPERNLDGSFTGVSSLREPQGTQVRLTATPPAPTIVNSAGFAETQPLDRTSFTHPSLRPSLETENPRLASKPKTEEECGHIDCDCMKPKLLPVLPFAEPVAPPVATQAPPSQLVSQPLSPILFDVDTRKVGVRNALEMKNNLLRKPIATLEKPVAGIARQKFNTPPVDTKVPRAPIVLNSTIKNDAPEMASTQLGGFIEKAKVETQSLCSSCDLPGCDGQCNKTQRRKQFVNLLPIVDTDQMKPNNVIIVATTTADTVPPFAEPPAMEVVESIPEIVMSMPEATKPFVPEFQGNFTPVNEPSVEKSSFEDFTEEDWTEMFGPVPVPEQTVQTKVCPSCNSSQCTDQLCGQKVHVATFSPPADLDLQFDQAAFVPVQTPVEEPSTQPEQFFPPTSDFPTAPIEVATTEATEENQFQVNGFIVSESQESNDESQWVAPTANFSPIARVEPPMVEALVVEPPMMAALVEAPMVEPAVADKAEFPATDSNSGHEEGLFPIIDTTIPPEPRVIIEVIDNTVPWGVKLNETIDNVRSQLEVETDLKSRNGLEVNLRLLEVLQRQMMTVEENQNALSNTEREYWQHQLDAITLMLPRNDRGASDFDRHKTAYQTLDHLRKAVERLESIANLKVSNGTFCTEISGFGKFKPFNTMTFKAGQKTLVYCEVENYLSQVRTDNYKSSFHTKLRGSYVVYDEQGRAVQQMEYPIVDDASSKRRRDFYLYFPIQIGKSLAPGNYRLELLVEDLGGNKTASLSPGMEFQVR